MKMRNASWQKFERTRRKLNILFTSFKKIQEHVKTNKNKQNELKYSRVRLKLQSQEQLGSDLMNESFNQFKPLTYS